MVPFYMTSRAEYALTYDYQFMVIGRLRVDGRLCRHFAGVDARSFEVHVPEQYLALVAFVPLYRSNTKIFFYYDSLLKKVRQTLHYTKVYPKVSGPSR
jgi:hypothetical protein